MHTTTEVLEVLFEVNIFLSFSTSCSFGALHFTWFLKEVKCIFLSLLTARALIQCTIAEPVRMHTTTEVLEVLFEVHIFEVSEVHFPLTSP